MWVNLNGIKIAVCTLGCKVNQYESDSVMDALTGEPLYVKPVKKSE